MFPLPHPLSLYLKVLVICFFGLLNVRYIYCIVACVCDFLSIYICLLYHIRLSIFCSFVLPLYYMYILIYIRYCFFDKMWNEYGLTFYVGCYVLNANKSNALPCFLSPLISYLSRPLVGFLVHQKVE